MLAPVGTLVCYDIVWTELDGHPIKHIDGSEYAVAPISGRKSAARFVAFSKIDREELCQLRKHEIAGWLVANARREELPYTLSA